MEGTVLLLLCLLSFLFGFFSVALYVSWQQAQHLMLEWNKIAPRWPYVGCMKVLQSWKDNPPHPTKLPSTLTQVEEIDEELTKMVDLGIRDFFERWYHKVISPDPVCVQQAREIMTYVLSEVTNKAKQVDYLTYFVETIMEDFMEHFKRYKYACSKVQLNEGEASGNKMTHSSRQRMIEQAFFESDSSDNPWEAVCLLPEARMVYLQRMTEILLFLLLPQDDFCNPLLQVLLTDVCVWQIWCPLLHTITQPDNFNHAIISLCKDSYLTPESFMSAMNDGSTELELRSFQRKVVGEIMKLKKIGVTDLDREKLNGLEAMKETAHQIMHSDDKDEDWIDNSGFQSFMVSIPCLKFPQDGSKHCSFVLDVRCLHNSASRAEQWTMQRSYRDFQDIHHTLRMLDAFPVSLTLPSIPTFKKMDPHRLELHRQRLEHYISVICGDQFLKEHPQANKHLIRFLTQKEFTRNTSELTRKVDSILKPLSNMKFSTSLKFPSKKLSSATSLPSLTGTGLATPISPSFSSASSSFPRPLPNTFWKTSEVKTSSSEEDEDSLPVNMMMVLLEELFDFSDKNSWLRRQLPTLLKQLAGGKISRKVILTTDWLTSPQQVALYIHDLTNTMWPGGVAAQPQPNPPSDIRALRSLIARAKLIGCIPDELKVLIGNESTVKGMARFCRMFQCESLNCCLALVILEGLLDTLLPSRNIKDTLRQLRTQISHMYTNKEGNGPK